MVKCGSADVPTSKMRRKVAELFCRVRGRVRVKFFILINLHIFDVGKYYVDPVGPVILSGVRQQ